MTDVHGPLTIFTASDCASRAVVNLLAAEDQLAEREAALAKLPEGTAFPRAEHTRNRIELGAAWCLLAEVLEGDRP